GDFQERPLHPRWFELENSFILPAGGGYMALTKEEVEKGGLLWPVVTVATAVAETESQMLYQLAEPAAGEWPAATAESELLSFHGAEINAEEAGVVEITSYWSVLGETERAWKIFVHLLDGNGEIVAQGDRLLVWSPAWRVGDRLGQVERVVWPAEGEVAQIMIGVYDSDSGQRQVFTNIDSGVATESISVR
ncbi:MAG TPA: hypothetical protein VLL52_11270, partial [Anaerolineae bacterium]|nr:hypothetical protein [Anaerolineae bacterium]